MSALSSPESHQDTVRRYFTKMSWQRQSPTAMLSWPQLGVESYFYAMSQPSPLLNPQRKESAKGRLTLGELFSGFRSE